MADVKEFTGTARRYTWTSFDIKEPTFDDSFHKYLCYQREICPTTTMAHWQGYVELKNSMRYKAMFKSLGIAHGHVEKSRGTAEENKAYCSKLESRAPGFEPKEFGTPSKQGARNDIKGAILALKEKGMKEVKENHADIYVKYHRGLEKLILKTEHRSVKPQVTWLWGDAGAGKTKFAHDYASQHKLRVHIQSSSMGNWWDGYDQQEVLILDDIREDTFKYHTLLQLLDRYPFTVQVKGGSVPMNSPYIFITCPYSSRDFNIGNENYAQLERRIDYEIHVLPHEERKPTKPKLLIYKSC